MNDIAAKLPSKALRPRWFHWLILTLLLTIGAGFRFDQITRYSQWPDEFWGSVYLASARGNQLFTLPFGQLLNPPPSGGLPGAPSWWHIWKHGMDVAAHPPLYPIMLRWWEDLFGEGDFSTRGFSSLMSLAGIVLLFDLVRREFNPNVALAAAAIMVMAASQLEYSQEARPYTLLTLEAIWACHVLLRIEQHGVTRWRLAEFATACACLELTHYLSVGAIFALGIYALIRLRGRVQWQTILAMTLSCSIAMAAWLPFLWAQRDQITGQGSWTTDYQPNRWLPLWNAVELPAFHILGEPLREQPIFLWAFALIIYVAPIIMLRRRENGLLLWMIAVGTIGSVMAYDFTHHAKLLTFERYTLLCTPMLCALSVLPIGRAGIIQWIVPVLVLLVAGNAAIRRWQRGPKPQADWRSLFTQVDQHARQDEPIVFSYNPNWLGPTIDYIGFTHYVPASRRAVMLLNGPADQAALAQLSAFDEVWLVGLNTSGDAANILPGWKSSGQSFSENGVGDATRLIRDHPATEVR